MATQETAPKIISRKEAKALGLRYYCTGKPCKRGHVGNRSVHNAGCLECHRIMVKAWNQRNPEAYLRSQSEYHERNRERCNEKSKRFHAAHRDAVRARQKIRHAKNRKTANLLSKLWRSANPETVNSYTRNRKARKRGNGGRHTAADIAALKKAQNGKCAYFSHCGRRLMNGLEKQYQVDHIFPLSKGGSNDRRNLQLLCCDCNREKHANDPIDHARTLGMLL